MKNTIALVVSAAIWSLQTFAADTTFTYQLLKESRSNISFPTYSTDEKKLVLEQVYLVLDEIFVHRDLKIQDFGTGADPLPFVKSMQDRVDHLSDVAFHSELTIIFNKMNDRHTSYAYPVPYQCYRTLLPFSFKEVIALNGEKVIAVNSISAIEDVLKLVPNLNVKVGDILISYDGKPVREILETLKDQTAGANPDAKTRGAVNLLSFTSQKYDLVPAKDNVELVFKNRQGQTYSTTVPWITRGDLKCLAPEKTEIETQDEVATDEYQNEFNRIYRAVPKKTKSLSPQTLKESADPILKYKIVKNEYGDFGYIRLDSFVPEKLSDEELVLEVKKLLLNEFQNTDGLIFDIRSNGGGYIYIAEAMVQLFTPKAPVPLKFRMKNSPANRHLMYEASPSNRFTTVLREAEASGIPYTKDLELNPAETVDNLGQYYFKPVAVFTNANCYSSCDMFSAGMQDHNAAIIVGEDSTTGAGGANNRTHRDTVKSLENNLGPFKKLPASQDVGFSFRQTVRSGKSEGVLIEDMGVLSDMQAPATLSDLYTDSGDQYKLIAKKLIERSSQHKAWVKIKEGRQDISSSTKPSVFIQWEEADTIIFRSNGETLQTLQTEISNPEGRSFELPAIKATAFDSGKYEIIGSKDGKRTWRKIFEYRIVPESISLEESLIINLAQENLLAIYNDENSPEDGWIVADGSLKTGVREEYADDVKTEASLFLKLSKTENFNLQFDAEVNTEVDFDYFRVKIRVDGKEIELIKGLSGKVELKTYEFDLSAYQGKNVEIRFIFESDAGITDTGVKLSNLKLLKK